MIDLLHRRGDGNAGSVQADERPPFVSDPAGLERLLAESRPLADGAALPPAAAAPDAGVEVVVAERALQPRREALFGDEAGACRADARQEMHLALLAGLEHAELAVFVWCVGKPIAPEQCGHASSLTEAVHERMPRRRGLELRRSGKEAVGVAIEVFAHVRPPWMVVDLAVAAED